jgi:hypothetical protein
LKTVGLRITALPCPTLGQQIRRSIIDLLVVEYLDWDNIAVLIRIPTLPKLSISLARGIPST